MAKKQQREAREAREARDRLRSYQAKQQAHERASGRRVRDNLIAVAAVVVVAALAAVAQISYFEVGPGAPTPTAEPTSAVPDPSLAEGRTWTGELTLNGGDVVLGVELDGALAPQAVSAILAGVQSDYYVDKTCHRMTTGKRFKVLQCGSIDGAGSSDPDFTYGPIENAPADDVYVTGTIAMARAGDDAASNGRQFFIVYGDTDIPADTAGGYSVVGTVTSGLGQLKKAIVSEGITPVNSVEDGTPNVPTTITGFTLE